MTNDNLSPALHAYLRRCAETAHVHPLPMTDEERAAAIDEWRRRGTLLLGVPQLPDGGAGNSSAASAL